MDGRSSTTATHITAAQPRGIKCICTEHGDVVASLNHLTACIHSTMQPARVVRNKYLDTDSIQFQQQLPTWTEVCDCFSSYTSVVRAVGCYTSIHTHNVNCVDLAVTVLPAYTSCPFNCSLQ